MTVDRASPDRVTPTCPKFGVCGGCSVMHMNRDSQLRLKQRLLEQTFSEYEGIRPETFLTPLSADRMLFFFFSVFFGA